MGFEEMGDDELVGWLGSWVGKVSGTVEFSAPGSVETTGKISVSVMGDLVRLELADAASRIPPERLSRGIEQGYVDAFKEAFRQIGMVFDRVESDVADNAELVRRIRRLREESADPSSLRRVLRRPRDRQEEAMWDPIADPLRRNL